MHRAISATISGRVQGVMFRDFTRRTARARGIVGEVENKEDGTVRVYAEGEEGALIQFIEKIKKGSLFSKVRSVEYQFEEPRGGYNTFSIIYE